MNNEAKILEILEKQSAMLEQMQQDVGVLKDDVSQLKKWQARTSVRLDGMENDLSLTKRYTSMLKRDIDELTDFVSMVKMDTDQIKEDVGQLKEDMEQVKEDAHETRAVVNMIGAWVDQAADIFEIEYPVESRKPEDDEKSGRIVELLVN